MALREEVVESARVPRLGPYAQAVRVGDLVFTAGQPGIDPATGQVAGVTFEAQARQAFANLRAVLEDAGSRMERVVKVTCFLADAGGLRRPEHLVRGILPGESAGALRAGRRASARAALLDRGHRRRRGAIARASGLLREKTRVRPSGVRYSVAYC